MFGQMRWKPWQQAKRRSGRSRGGRARFWSRPESDPQHRQRALFPQGERVRGWGVL